MIGILILLMLVLTGLVLWLIHDMAELEDQLHDRDRVVRTQLQGLRSAERLNVAFWRAKEELEAEAERHRGGEPPW